MLIPHFFIFSSFSTATPRFLSSVIDELLLLWCMLESETGEQNTRTQSHAENICKCGKPFTAESTSTPYYTARLNGSDMKIRLKCPDSSPSPLRQNMHRSETELIEGDYKFFFSGSRLRTFLMSLLKVPHFIDVEPFWPSVHSQYLDNHLTGLFYGRRKNCSGER